MDDKKKLQIQVNNIIDERRKAIFTRLNSIDEKHDTIWMQFGYPEEITPQMFRSAYRRQDLAQAAINRTIDKTWQTMPQVIEDDNSDNKVNTKWEVSVNKLMSNAFRHIIDADRKNLINRFSAVIVKFKDGLDYDNPVDLKIISRLKNFAISGYLTAWEDQIKAVEWDTDINSESYGKVTMWSFNESAVDGDASGSPKESRNIHHSRVIIIAEGSYNDDPFSGVPFLEAGFNSLIDMQKIKGSAAEGSFKNSGRQLHVNYDTEVSIADLMSATGSKTPEDLKKKIDNDIHSINSHIDSVMLTSGASVTPLSVNIGNPYPSWTLAANSFCASISKPFTVIVGQQTGRLASEQDQIDFNTGVESRRVNFVNDGILKKFIDMFCNYGMVDKKDDYLIKWDSLLEASESAKADLFNKLAAGNKLTLESNLQPALTNDEMRVAAGYEPSGDDKIPERMKEDDPENKDK